MRAFLAPLVEEKYFFCEHLFVHPEIPKWEGVRGERFVYARYFDRKPAYEYLHDLRKDPKEIHNFVGDKNYAVVLERMKRRLKALKDTYGGDYSLERFPLRAKPDKS